MRDRSTDRRIDRRVFAVALCTLLLATACSVTVVTPTPTRTAATLPPASAPGASIVSTRPQTAQASPTPTVAPAVTPSATATRVLKAPLPALATPTASATAAGRTSVPLAVQPAASGKLVLQAASGGDLVTLPAGGGAAARLAAGLDPAWSPDGRQIAFTSWSYPEGIYVMNADGSNLHMVYEVTHAKSPTWSPDGSKIAFTWIYKTVLRRGRPDDYWRVSIYDLASGNKTDMPLDPDQRAWAPDWGPDGRLVYKGMRGLFVSDLSNTPQQITDDPLDTTPAWSPDGSRIALAVRKQDHWDIAVAAADGHGLTQLTMSSIDINVKPVNNVAPRWSPDGKSIAFVSDRGGAWAVYIMTADGSGQRRLLDTAITYDFADERVFTWTK